MKNDDVMRINETMLWVSTLVCGILTYYNSSYGTLLIIWTLMIILVGNARRIYSTKYVNTCIFLRRSIYIWPLLLPMLFGFQPSLSLRYVGIWIIIGVLSGLLFILPKLTEWKIALSKDFISFSEKRRRAHYMSQILLLIGAAIGEELFFRDFILQIDQEGMIFPFILSVSLFLLHHFGVKWNQQFTKYDYTVQIIFGIYSAILMIISGSVIPSVVAHITYNSPRVILSIKSYFYHYRIKSMERSQVNE